jgi:hypothetical protein
MNFNSFFNAYLSFFLFDGKTNHAPTQCTFNQTLGYNIKPYKNMRGLIIIQLANLLETNHSQV